MTLEQLINLVVMVLITSVLYREIVRARWVVIRNLVSFVVVGGCFVILGALIRSNDGRNIPDLLLLKNIAADASILISLGYSMIILGVAGFVKLVIGNRGETYSEELPREQTRKLDYWKGVSWFIFAVGFAIWARFDFPPLDHLWRWLDHDYPVMAGILIVVAFVLLFVFLLRWERPKN